MLRRHALKLSVAIGVGWACANMAPSLSQAQIAGPGGAVSAPSAPSGAGASAPGISGGAQAPSGISPSTTSTGAANTQTLTLAQVVGIAVNNSASVIEARHRLAQAQEQIAQVEAQNLPQVRVDASDTLNSYASVSPTLGPTVVNPTLPGGGAIPTITDQAASDASTLSAISSGGAPIGIVAPGIAAANATGQNGPPAAGASTGNPSGVPTASTPVQTPSAPSQSSASMTPPAGMNVSPVGPAGSTTGAAPSSGTSPSSGTAPCLGGTTGGVSPSVSPSAPSLGGSSSTTPGSSGATSPDVSPGAVSPAPSAPSSGGGTGGASMPTLGNGESDNDVQGAALPIILQQFMAATDTGGYAPADEATTREVSASSDQSPASQPSPSAVHSDALRGALPDQTSQATDQTVLPSTTTTEAEHNAVGARLSASQYIDIFGFASAARTVERATRDFYALDLQSIQNQTALTAKAVFFNVLLAQSNVASDQEQVQYATEDVRITTARRQQGIAADYDVLTAETLLANAQQSYITAQDAYSLAQTQLDYLLGIDSNTSPTLNAPQMPPLSATIDTGQAIDAAYKRRPELHEADRNVAIAQRLVKLASEGTTPTLGIVGIAESSNVSSTFAPANLASVSAQLGIPLYDGGATRSRVREAKDALQQQQTVRAALRLSVALEVRQAALNVRSAQVRVQSAQVAVAQGDEALRLANIRFQNGLGTFLDVTNALAQLSTAQTNLSNAQFFYEISLAQLVRDEGSM